MASSLALIKRCEFYRIFRSLLESLNEGYSLSESVKVSNLKQNDVANLVANLALYGNDKPARHCGHDHKLLTTKEGDLYYKDLITAHMPIHKDKILPKS